MKASLWSIFSLEIHINKHVITEYTFSHKQVTRLIVSHVKKQVVANIVMWLCIAGP